MAIILQDSFVGSAGNLDGRTPDVPFAGLNWFSDPGDEPLELTGTGAVQSVDQAAVDSRGFGDIGAGGVVDYDLPTGVNTTITFVIKTGSSTTLGATAYEGFGLTVEAGGSTFGCSLFGPDTTDGRPWQINEDPDGDSNAVTTPVANTEYTGTYEVADGVQTLNFMGNTVNSTVAFATPSIGVNRISVKVGAGFTLLSITAEDDRVETISIAGAVPALTGIIRTGIRISDTLPMPTLAMVVSQKISSIEATMPVPVPSVRLGNRVAATMPMPTGLITGTTTGMIRVEVTAPMPTLAASITSPGHVTVVGTVPAPTGTVRGGARIIDVVSMPTGSIRGTTGSKLIITSTVPMPDGLIQMTSGNTMSFALSVPMPEPGPWGRIVGIVPMAHAEITLRSVVTVTYEAYAVNLKHNPKQGVEAVDEVTRYTNYPFNQIVRYKDQYYGVADTGLYLLGGATDDGDPIGWAWKTALEDNDVLEKKTVRSAYFSGRVGQDAVITVYAGESGQNAYTYNTPRDANPQNYRKVFGRGVKGRYYAIGATGEVTFNLDGLDLEVDKLARKI